MRILRELIPCGPTRTQIIFILLAPIWVPAVALILVGISFQNLHGFITRK